MQQTTILNCVADLGKQKGLIFIFDVNCLLDDSLESLISPKNEKEICQNLSFAAVLIGAFSQLC